LTRTQEASYHYSNKSISSVNPLRLAWVNLLSRYEWTWFTKLTFRDLPKSFTAVNRVKKWLAVIQEDEKDASSEN